MQKVAPKIAPFDFGEEPLNYGEPASIQCTILGGDLPINVTWLLNNAAIDSFHDISLSRIGKRVNVLTIEAVAAHHAGNYSCRAHNKAGITEHAARLIVNGLFFYLLRKQNYIGCDNFDFYNFFLLLNSPNSPLAYCLSYNQKLC